jgi:sulfonate transport system permease protein
MSECWPGQTTMPFRDLFPLAVIRCASKGLGFLLIDCQNTGRTDVMLLAIVLLAGLGKLSDAALGTLERRMVRRRN